MALVIVGWRVLGLPVPGSLLTLVLHYEMGQKEQRAGPWPLPGFPALGRESGSHPSAPCCL